MAVLGMVGGVGADDPAEQPVAPKPDAAQAAAEPAAEPFGKVHGEWQAVEKQLDEIVAKFRKAPVAEREALRKKYLGLLDEAKAIVVRLRRSALATLPSGAE